MIFLIDYDRGRGHLVALHEFSDSDRARAEDARLRLEISQHQLGIDREVVLLEAADRAALERTHGRYFKTLRELIGDLESSTSTYTVGEREDFVVRERKD